MLSEARKNLAVAALASCLGLITLVGCKPGESSADKGPVGDVRGEPINAVKTSPAAAPKTETTNAVVESKPAVPVEVKPVSASVTQAKAQSAAAVQKDGDYLLVGFDKLASYNFIVPDEDPATNKVAIAGPDKADDQIPDSVKAFNKKKVTIKGFMLPLKVEGGSVTEFLIMKDQSMCCYGTVPKITEWVSVKTAGKGVKPVMDQAVNVQGTLKVGAMRENGYLVGIYEMDGERLTEAGD